MRHDVQLREANQHDLYEVLRNPSDITREEISSSGLNSWQALQHFSKLLKSARSPITTMIEGQSVAVFGHNADENFRPVRIMWFLAKEAYFALGARGVLGTRKQLKQLQMNYPKLAFESYTLSKHPAVERWFTALGFKEQWAKNPTYRLFTLPAVGDKDDAKRLA